MQRLANNSDTMNEKTPLRDWDDVYLATEHDRHPSRTHKNIMLLRNYRQTTAVLLLIALLVTFCLWRRTTIQTNSDFEIEMKDGFLRSENDTYDATKKIKPFHGTRLQELDPTLLPGGDSDPRGEKRLIFVGDIHGCSKELKKLLAKVEFDSRRDHLIAVGDTISKGPDNVGVLDELMRIGASSVRGNHEDRILALAPAVLESGSLPVGTDSYGEKFAKDSKLLRDLSPYHLDYLRSMSLMFRVPPLPQAKSTTQKHSSPIGEEILVVHAGLVPALPLDKQDPYFVMNMRSIHKKTHAPFAEAESKKAKTEPWHELWNWYNDRLYNHKSLKDFRVSESTDVSATGTGWFEWLRKGSSRYPKPQVVVYGHRSKEGLQIERWSKGLDTGCVTGGRLTALVLDAKGRQDIVHVGCKDYR